MSSVGLRENFRSRSSSIEALMMEVRNAFDPNAKFIQCWHQALLLCLLYEVIVIPFLLTFKSSADVWLTPELMAVYACELLFVADVYVELNTGYYEDGNVTRDAKKARVKYIKSARFALDMAALPPLSLLAANLSSFSPVYLELHKLLRVWRIPKYIAMLDDVYAKHFELLKMFKVLVVTVLLSHFVACVRFAFGFDAHGDNHWLPHPPHHELHAQSKYLMSLYWAFGILTGLFEGELPYTIPQFVFTIFVALCGFSLFTYLCATFFMISKCESGDTETAEARINQFKHLLSFHHVPDQLQHQAIGYLKRYYTYSESNDREAMRLLCPSIAKDIQVALLKDMVGNIVFFQGCNEQFIVAITSLLEMIALPANFTVFHTGDLGDAMYVVNSGVLHVIVDGVKVREVRKGSFFGEMAMFLNRPRFATVVTTTYCSLYKLVRFQMERVLEGYPEYATSIPGKVEEMAKVLFGPRVLFPTKKPRSSAHDAADSRPDKKSIGSLLRKHVKLKDKSRVAPSIDTIAISALAIAHAGQPSPVSNMAKVAPEPMEQEKRETPAATPPERMPPVIEDIANGANRRRQTPPLARVGSARASVSHAIHQFYAYTIRGSLLQPDRSALTLLFLLRRGIEVESKKRLVWMILLQANLIYNWFFVPLQLAFELLDQKSAWYLVALDTAMDVMLWADLYLNFNFAYVQDAEKIWDTTKIARRYLTSWFALDLVSLLPYQLVFAAAHHATTRIPRLLRVVRLSGHFHEIDERIQLTSKQRLFLFGVMLTMMYHIIACLHFSITYLEGFSSDNDAWIPSDDIELVRLNSTHYVDVSGVVYADDSSAVVTAGFTQYFRSLYYAANVLTALGRSIEPQSDTQYAAALVFMLSGFFITAVVVDNVQKRFTASAIEQKEFFATRSRIQLFLRRQNAPLAIHKRVNAFLDFWWSAHRGAVIGELLEELPETIKRAIIKSICGPALQTLALLNGARPVLAELEHVFVDNIKFILYGQGEIVYRQGDYASGLFFLLDGDVCVIANGGSPRSVSLGGFFGTAALRLDDTAANYSERVSAISGCILLFVSREHLLAMKATFEPFPDAMRALEKRLMDPKLAKASMLDTGAAQGEAVARHPVVDKVFGLCLDVEAIAYDPDSVRILLWETFVFVAMSAQWAVVMFHICFGVDEANHTGADAFTVVVELLFLLDIFVRSHLGYYEFGNKVMDLIQIKRRYFHSREFAIDALALLPLFLLNWTGTNHLTNRLTHRWELLNLNKLLRLFKVPTQLAALENKYLKYTLELRLFKLVYYTFLLSHTFGCIWFDFASHASGVQALFGSEAAATAAPSFGNLKWLPPQSLANGTLPLQYFASLFWSFGLMSASSPGEFPKTIAQSAFSVVTMTIGFFLFAYVVGNFLDIIELMDAENREFYAKLGSLRHLMAHFQLPAPIEDKFKAYFFFKRFHSITQEYLLERCLPPSLLADIRMVHLQPMILKVSFLSDMEGSVTRMLVSQFSQVLVVKDEFVYKFGEEGSDMYFVFTGALHTLLPRDEFLRVGAEIHRRSSVVLSAENDKPEVELEEPKAHLPQPLTKLNQIGAGSYFGENALFFNSVRSSYVRAKSSCILYRLSRHSLELVFNRYPDWKHKVLRMMTVQQEQQRLNRIAFEERQNVAMGTEMAHVDLVNAQAQKTEEELLFFRRMRINAASRRKQSQTTRFLHTSVTQASDVGRQLGSRFHVPKALQTLLAGAPAQSTVHLHWLRLVSFTTIFMAIVVPYRIAFDDLERATGIAACVRVVEALCELLFLADIWVNWRIKSSNESMDLYEQDHRDEYRKERLVWDILAALPVDYVVTTFSVSPWCQSNRCCKLRNFVHYMNELNRRSISNEMHRLRTTALVYILIIYWSACTYFAIAIYDRFGTEWQAWLPEASLRVTTATASSDKLTLRLLRGLFFATTAFVKKCRTFIPDSTLHFVFSIVTSFAGLLIMAFMIGDMASLFISYIGNEVEYRKNHIAVERYLSRWKITGDLKIRTHAFLSSLWSSHRGVDYQSLLGEVPTSIRTESILNIASWPLLAFMDDVFRPICRSDTANIESLMQSIARHLRFEGYPRGENVLVEGNIAQSMYFVVRGQLYALSRSQPNTYRSVSYSKGDFFGEKGVLGYSVGVFSVRTLRACDLLSLSSEALLTLLSSHPIYGVALSFADQAAQHARAHPEARTTDSETRWGRAVLDVIRKKREECANLKLCAIIDARFAMKTAEAAFGTFRPLLELVVPNGSLSSYGVLSKKTQFARAFSQNLPTTVFSEGDMEPSHASGVAKAAEQRRVEPVGPDTSVNGERDLLLDAPKSVEPQPCAERDNEPSASVDHSEMLGSGTLEPRDSPSSSLAKLPGEPDRMPMRSLASTTSLLALARGSHESFLGSAIRRASDGSTDKAMRPAESQYNRSSETSNTFSATTVRLDTFDVQSLVSEVLEGSHLSELRTNKPRSRHMDDSFRGLTPSLPLGMSPLGSPTRPDSLSPANSHSR